MEKISLNERSNYVPTNIYLPILFDVRNRGLEKKLWHCSCVQMFSQSTLGLLFRILNWTVHLSIRASFVQQPDAHIQPNNPPWDKACILTIWFKDHFSKSVLLQWPAKPLEFNTVNKIWVEVEMVVQSKKQGNDVISTQYSTSHIL